MATDYTASVEPVLRPLLRDGESVLVASPLVPDPGTTEDVSVADELKNLLDPTILLGLGTHPGELLARAAFGRAVLGGPDSVARKVYDAARGKSAVAVTERRLLLYRTELVDRPGRGFWQRWFGPAEQVAHALCEVDRSRVVGAVPAPAGALRRGRILVIFTDRSACALVCGLPALGRRVADAIGPPQPAIQAEGEDT